MKKNAIIKELNSSIMYGFDIEDLVLLKGIYNENDYQIELDHRYISLRYYDCIENEINGIKYYELNRLDDYCDGDYYIFSTNLDLIKYLLLNELNCGISKFQQKIDLIKKYK